MSIKLPEKICKLIDDKNLAHFATLKKDGSPHVAPVWIDRDGDTILINTTSSRLKYKNVQNDKRVSLSIADYKDPYTWASIIGEVVELSSVDAETHIDKMSQKYLGIPKFPWKNPTESRKMIKIIPIIAKHS
ncbi:MAG: PPOX class F420-dependent oxidoreductase [Thaumarchaeota archaeon]|nr:MAG: PPOX class F420-dependent oxidoreductase [Nitrososphaerota archaeon]